VACDIPSGIDPDKGEIYDTFVDADYILFLSLPKIGCEGLIAEKFVADISVPIELYPMIGLEKKDPFKNSKILSL
jgi:hypothetical protein